MEHNEISMYMDVKLDIHDKRSLATKFKSWRRCQVKIEAIKCVPCFLRFSFLCHDEELRNEQHAANNDKCLTVSVNVPGVSLSLTTSRTKQFSYLLCWTQNRRDCYIYFALETEASCRRHMKWIKKSIKNLELYRQVFLEQRRLSRGPARLQQQLQLYHEKNDSNDLGTLPKLPDVSFFDTSTFATRASRVSEIYEEIFEESRLSRRYSRASIASGIYEEMKPSALNFQSIMEEPPALPPLPTQRKRINTYDADVSTGRLGEIPRSNTNPESELAKKKKYKIMFDNIFGGARQKRAGSVSECTTAVAAGGSKKSSLPAEVHHMYENAPTPPLASIKAIAERNSSIANSHRNSFSSPDLSKLNFIDTFDESHFADFLQRSFQNLTDDLDVDLLENTIEDVTSVEVFLQKIQSKPIRAESLESLNVSEQLPNNFNFSACNSSTMNLIGANGAVPQISLLQKNKILVDDLTGYCVMAPIVKKATMQLDKPNVEAGSTTESTTSGYSTGSYCSSTSSCNNEEHAHPAAVMAPPPPQPVAHGNDSDIYEPMHGSGILNASNNMQSSGPFVEHLYENLLAVKAAQELEQNVGTFTMSTSTPTDSPQVPALPQKGTPKSTTNVAASDEQEEDFYQTPRKSIISVDEKIPSYYPNSCDAHKSKRHNRSPAISSEKSNTAEKVTSTGLRHLVNMKIRRERKENLYISSPQEIIEQRKKSKSSSVTSNKSSKGKKPTAHKISDNVYAVTHAGKKSSKPPAAAVAYPTATNTNNNNESTFTSEMQDKLQAELLQLAVLQNIDFKFDDGGAVTTAIHAPVAERNQMPSILPTSTEAEYEHCYQAAESATRLLQKYATLAKFGGNSSNNSAKTTPLQQKQQLPEKHQLKVNQTENKLSSPGATSTKSQLAVTPTEIQLTSSGKKFASLPRFKKIDFSPLKLRINNVLQRNQHQPDQQY